MQVMARFTPPRFIHQGLKQIAQPALEPDQEEFGAGDLVRGVTERFGIKKKCAGCDQRQERMNKAIRFGRPR